MGHLRDKLTVALREATREGDPVRLATLRLILTAIRDRDMARRSEDGEAVPEREIVDILARMIAQREESASAYEEAGRLDAAEEERTEIAIIRAFLPKPLKPAERDKAIEAAIAETGARGIRDLGRVMARLKARHPARMDFVAVGALVKARLTGG